MDYVKEIERLHQQAQVREAAAHADGAGEFTHSHFQVQDPGTRPEPQAAQPGQVVLAGVLLVPVFVLLVVALNLVFQAWDGRVLAVFDAAYALIPLFLALKLLAFRRRKRRATAHRTEAPGSPGMPAHWLQRLTPIQMVLPLLFVLPTLGGLLMPLGLGPDGHLAPLDRETAEATVDTATDVPGQDSIVFESTEATGGATTPSSADPISDPALELGQDTPASGRLFHLVRSHDLEGLLAAGPQDLDMSALDSNGQPALMVALVDVDALPLVNALIALGADANQAEREGRRSTPLMMAAARDQVRAVQALANAGAQIHTRDRFGKNALDYAEYFGSTGAGALLCTLGAQATPQDPAVPNHENPPGDSCR